jgi:hypothetical protein
MVTPLHKPVKRELRVRDSTFTLTISPDSLKLTLKGRRKGYELKWEDLVSGDAALAAALNASLGKFGAAGPTSPPVPARAKNKSSRPRAR